MAQLIVRNIDEDLVKRLKRRASRAGRSAEEEHRRILREALALDDVASSLKSLLSDIPEVGTNRDFRRSRDRGRRVRL
jgi:antitoxin FitA